MPLREEKQRYIWKGSMQLMQHYTENVQIVWNAEVEHRHLIRGNRTPISQLRRNPCFTLKSLSSPIPSTLLASQELLEGLSNCKRFPAKKITTASISAVRHEYSPV
jgi:hypothetical protein